MSEVTVLLALLLLLPPALADAVEQEADAAGAPQPTGADEPEPEPEVQAEAPEWIELEVPADFGSALDSSVLDKGLAPEEDTGSLPLPEHLQLLGEEPTLRGRWGFRPWLGVAGMDDAWGGDAGAMVSHQWWSLKETAVRPAGETRLRVSAPFGFIKGWDVRLDSTHGAWLGPVGLLVGPALRAGGRNHMAGHAASSLGLGPQGRLALRLGPVVPWATLTPTWHLAGSRAPLDDAPWDELAVGGGVALDTRPVGLRLSSEWARAQARYETDELAPTTLWEVSLGIHLRLL